MKTKEQQEECEKSVGKMVELNEAVEKEHLAGMVLASVEETLNALLDAEADRLCRAQRYERSEQRCDTRAGKYERQLDTKAGRVKLQVPKLRTLPFETAIIERYQRRESSVEEALIEMYLAGVSVRRIEDITEALWGSKVSAGSNLNQKIYAEIEQWRQRPLSGKYPYVYLDGIWLKRSWGGEVKNVSVLVAIGVNENGYREVLAVSEGTKEDVASWQEFMRQLKQRGLAGVRLFISDKCLGLVASVAGKLSAGKMAAVRGALLSQRVALGAEREGESSGGDAQGDPRAGRLGGGARQGESRGE
jgi:transposase-like protein